MTNLKGVIIPFTCDHCNTTHDYSVEDVRITYITSVHVCKSSVKCKTCSKLFSLPTTGFEVFETKALQNKLDHIYDLMENGILN